MAEILEDHEVPHRMRELQRPPRAPSYPWDEWSDGKTRRLTMGVDFHCTPRSMRRLTHRAARNRGLGAYTSIRDKVITIRFIELAGGAE